MNGRKPKPPELKVFNGNPGKRRIKKVPKPPNLEALPEPPEWMGKYGKEYWAEHAGHLFRMGMLTVLDVSEFSRLCSAYHYMREAQDDIDKNGIIMLDEKGKPFRNPATMVQNQMNGIVNSLTCRFGLSPSDRTRIANHSKEEDKGVKEFLA